MKSITPLQVQKVKRRAKQLKSEFPELPLGKRLNIAARRLLNVNTFHEVNKICAKQLESQFEYAGSDMVNCHFCDLTFVTSDPNDIKFHFNRHLEYEKAEETLKYAPLRYTAQEKIKQLGHSEITHKSDSIQYKGALRVLRSHFDRSLDAAIIGKYWRQHPSFEEYISIIDVAVTYDFTFPPKVIAKIIKEYGKKDCQVKVNTTNWYPTSL